MRMYDILAKKRDGLALAPQELEFFARGAADGSIPDYQLSAMLMAIYLNGMSDEETAALTDAMARSGDLVDLSPIPGVKVDKHSTGGVGDKTTLIVGPIVAACGVPVAKMSGAGLGHTGGTIDKLRAIPGFETQLEKERFFEIVRTVGLAVISQSGNIAPADKKLYALRDVTATIGSLPLIASSVMSKKIASGADAILLDVKTGDGAFMKTPEEAVALARCMVGIGEAVGRRTAALITGMDRPLGYAVGNALEVAEAIRLLGGEEIPDLREVCLALAAGMLHLAGKGEETHCRLLAEQALKSGRALEKLRQMIAAQGGDSRVTEDPSLLPLAPVQKALTAWQDGFVEQMAAQHCGTASMLLGAGRAKKEDPIDYGAGIRFLKKPGDPVQKGEALAILYTSDAARLPQAEEHLRAAIRLSGEAPRLAPLLYARVTRDGVQHF